MVRRPDAGEFEAALILGQSQTVEGKEGVYPVDKMVKFSPGFCPFLEYPFPAQYNCKTYKYNVFWCKKQTVVANSTIEAEYIAASHCYGQVLWIQNQMLDYGYNFMKTKIHVDTESAICVIKNPIYHSKTKHIEIRHHFIRDSYEKKLIEMVKIHTDNNVVDLLTKAFDISRFNFLVIKESSIRCTLRLDDAEGTSCLTNAEIFEGLARMGTMASAIICLATNQKFNLSRYILLSLVKNIEAGVPFFTFPRKSTNQRGSTPNNLEPRVPPTESQAKQNIPLHLPSYGSLPSGEDSLKLKELIDFCTNLSNKVLYLESEVIDIKSTYQARIEKLESKVERLKEENRVLKELKSVHFKVDSNETVMEMEKSSKQERKIADINADVLSMMDVNDEEPADVEEVIEVVKAAKLITKVVTTARVDVNAASIQDTTVTAAEATKNMAGYKMDYFKGMSYDEIRPLFEKHYNYNQDFLNVVNEGVKVLEKEVRQEKEVEVESSKREGESLEQEITKNQKMEQEIDELKKHLQIVPDDDDDVEDLESLWNIVRERFTKTEAKNYSNDFLINTLKIMFEKPNVEANVWKDKKGKYGLAKVKRWKLFESCGVHCLALSTTHIFLLVERMYPLTHFTLEQMMHDVRLEVEDESEMYLELLS
nr:putative ribonuclease H-like domain-containing protein [Tanacetum cinerariifolium]